jgi:hypothetical protein
VLARGGGVRGEGEGGGEGGGGNLTNPEDTAGGGG